MHSDNNKQGKNNSHEASRNQNMIPDFLSIKARQISDWAESHIDARSYLPVLLRKLIHSTGTYLSYVDFPGYDNAQRRGSDGIVEAGKSTPWIPKGKSYWEFGTDQNPAVKAEKDYTARLKSISFFERIDSTYVFVTPRKWNGKTAWEKQKNEEGEWKQVRAFDASDLEQWLEQSVPTQVWLAEQLSLPTDGYETLETHWNNWTNASEPTLTSSIFKPSINTNKNTLKKWLAKSNNKPLVITADSKDEALAFLYCLFNDEDLRQYKDLVAVFKSPQTLNRLISSSIAFIPIVYTEETERELNGSFRDNHCIIFRSRNAIEMEADIRLDLLSYEHFKEALNTMGIKGQSVDRLAKESGRSPTILRRRLSQNAAIRKPIWASENYIAKSLVPISLIGMWHTDQDRTILSYLANKEYEIVEDNIVSILKLDDSPIWSTGKYRGVVSKIDTLFAISPMITSEDLERFLHVAKTVLSELDPALELPEKDRWAASLYNKKRTYSATLRKSINETLVILSIHGNALFFNRLGIDIESKVRFLVQNLLTPLSLDVLLSHNIDLPYYAEVAPNEFLKIIQKDLQQDEPLIIELLKPVDSNLIGVSPSRTGFLWALESLAWESKNLLRVCLILARLSQVNIEDNWANKPENSLKAIFRSWMPQTAATVEERLKVFKTLMKRFPDVTWKIAIDQFKPGTRIGSYSYRPKWRDDASGAGEVVSNNERIKFNQSILEYLIDWPNHTFNTLGDLVEVLQCISIEYEEEIWNKIDAWAVNADDESKTILRERIRRYIFTVRGSNRKLEEVTRNRANEVYYKLQPNDVVKLHRWLFLDSWIHESVDEMEDEEFNFQKRQERLDNLRQKAMGQIWDICGFEGVKELISYSNAPQIIGACISPIVTDVHSRISLILECLLQEGEQKKKHKECIRGLLHAGDFQSYEEVIKAVANKLPLDKKHELFVCAPAGNSTWRVLESYEREVRKRYWQNVLPLFTRFTPSELTELINCLLEVRRPRVALNAVHLDFKNVETSKLKKLLISIATTDSQNEGINFQSEGYHISAALQSLDGRPDITRDEMIQLEFIFSQVLDQSEYGIPNIEEEIRESPDLFVQLVAFAFNRSDEGEDSLEWKIQNPKQKEIYATFALTVLDNINIIPGAGTDGKIDVDLLNNWLAAARKQFIECGRSVIGDQYLGQLLAKSPASDEDIWPREEICEAMENISSHEIAKGFTMGIYNLRGVHIRGIGGVQERALAAKYRNWAEIYQFEYPYVAMVLEEISESYVSEARKEDTEENLSKRMLD